MVKQIYLKPELRFPAFSDDWKALKLGEVFEFKVTNSFSRDNLNYEYGAIKNIHYGDIHTKFQTLFDISKEMVPFINDEMNVNRISEDFYCREGDIVFADASEDLNDVGKSIEIVNLNNEKLLSGLHTLLARPIKSVFTKGFGGYLFKSNSVRIQIQKEAQGSKVLSINVGRVSNINISFPTLPEQQKIASFLSAVDEKLQALKKRKSLLEQYKKGVLQKIFSQELRFKADDGSEFPEWEVKTLGEVCEEHLLKNAGNNYPEVFSVAKHKGVINQIEHLGRSFSAKEISHYKLIFPGDLVYTKSPTADFPFGIIKQNRTGRIGVVSPLYCVFKPKTYSLGYILHEYFSSEINVYNYLNPLVQKGAKNTMNINNGVFFNGAGIILPIDHAEQTKIANFLSAIDEKIEMVQGQVDKMEVWKKGLLQKMFA